MAENSKDSTKSFKDTLNLPRTDFPIRSNPKIDDPTLIKRWINEDLFKKSYYLNQGHKKFILHDGPPYANGNIHLGHAYNKILKDIVTKSYRMAGYYVPVKPGWDCHGLPIELKVIKENPNLNGIELIKACRKYADHWIGVQKKEFEDLGVLMNWQHPYITMDFSYESKILRAFGDIFNQGFIERKYKTVPWCPHCQTVLAAAEIEYKERKDPSIYVLFDLEPTDAKKLFPEIQEPISIVIWTTTPWTLPLNRAVLANPNSEYVLLNINGQNIIVGSKVADDLIKNLEKEKKIIKTFSANYLKDLFVKHPFIDLKVPIIFDESVGVDEGTAFVHCAPGVGPLDYEIALKNNLEIYSPISSDGIYTEGILPEELVGMKVSDGQGWVINKLTDLGKLLYKTSIKHSYPHCWRCLNALIFRATLQWFFDLNKENVREKALGATEKIEFIPARGRNFLRATIQSRLEWCLSRQRVWGVPIPALLCENCDYAYLTQNIISKVAIGVEEKGIEYWYEVPINELVDTNFSCPGCGEKSWKKEFDILDVWFDAGVSHYAVLYNSPELGFPADLYLEGIDQYRGWFQSSLLTSLVLEKEAAMKTIMTHGFTVDEEGHKMSKSRGNVVSPQDIINRLGTDGLRLWVTSFGHDTDPMVSNQLLQNIAEVYRKIRNTCRFLLSNLYDFNFEKDSIVVSELLPLDYYALTELEKLNSEIIQHYLEGDFTAVFHKLTDFCTVDMSSFFLDIVKDRLYVEKPTGKKRRSVQTVLWYILDTITRLSAPIMSFTAETLSDFYQMNKDRSIHLQSFVNPKDLYNLCYTKKEKLFWPTYQMTKAIEITMELEEEIKEIQHFELWQMIKEIRSEVLKAIEIEREKDKIKHSLEASISIYFNFSQEKLELLQKFINSLKLKNISCEEFFKELFIVSRCYCKDNPEGLMETSIKGVFIKVNRAEGDKCPRCWQWDITDHPDKLCRRCQEVLRK